MGIIHIGPWASVCHHRRIFRLEPRPKAGGPIGMLIATLFVCAPICSGCSVWRSLGSHAFAGGPLAYGRRAVGPLLGFVMGWSMFLEALFATIGTALATGGYIYFIFELAWPGIDRSLTTTLTGLATVLVFAIVQWLGAGTQAKVTEWMTYGAILVLIWFWIACLPGVHVDRILTQPLLTKGWNGVLQAIPFAIWWLVMIETVALAPEEAHEPQRTIPRGLTLAQLTLIILVLMTWFVAAGAGSDPDKTGDEAISFPLPFVYKEVWPNSGHLLAFSVAALFGMVVSYNGMIYAVTRQSFALGRAGYLPRGLGNVHVTRRTPTVSILVWSLVVAGFVVWGYFDEKAILVAVVTCNLAALVWYALAMMCLIILRRRAPEMPRPYKSPWYPVLPVAVICMSLFAAVLCVWYPTAELESHNWFSDYLVLWLTLGLYGSVSLLPWRRAIAIDPGGAEELAAREAS